MKIALLTVTVHTHSVSRAPLDLARSLKKLGHELTIIATDLNIDSELVKKLNLEQINLIFVRSRGLFSIYEVAQKLQSQTFDVASFHSTLPFLLGAKLARIPIVRTYYGTQIDAVRDKFFPQQNIFIQLINKTGNLIIRTVELLILFFSDNIVAISKYTKKEIENMYHFSAICIYPGTLTRIPKRLYTSKTKQAITILSVSRIVPYKGFHHLIGIFNQLRRKYPHTQLKIIGTISDMRYLDFLTKIKSPGITIITNASNKELMKAYREAHIYATCDRFLFWGLPVLEAATYELPSVSLNYAACNEVIQHRKTGFVANTHNEFLEYLTKLVVSPRLRSAMGRRARKRAREFSWSKTALQYEKIFTKTIS